MTSPIQSPYIMVWVKKIKCRVLGPKVLIKVCETRTQEGRALTPKLVGEPYSYLLVFTPTTYL